MPRRAAFSLVFLSIMLMAREIIASRAGLKLPLTPHAHFPIPLPIPAQSRIRAAFAPARPRLIARGLAGYDVIPAGRWDADALPDLLLRSPDGTLLRFTGNLAGGWAGPGPALASGLQSFDSLIALQR